MSLWSMLNDILIAALALAVAAVILVPLAILARRARLDRQEHWDWFHPGADEDTGVLTRLPRHRLDTVETPFRLPGWR